MTDRAALAALTAEIVACRRCPRLVAWRERVAREKVARFRDETYWGRPLPGFGDPGRPDPAARARAGRPRRQPDGAGLHRRCLGRLPVGRAPRGRPRRPAGLAPRRRRPDPDRRVHRGCGPLRAAGQQADPDGARHVRALPRPRARPPDGGAGRRGARGVRLGRGAASLRGDGSRGRGRGPGSATAPRSASGRTPSWAATTRASRTPSPAGSRRACSTRSCDGRSSWPPHRSVTTRCSASSSPEAPSSGQSATRRTSTSARRPMPWSVTSAIPRSSNRSGARTAATVSGTNRWPSGVASATRAARFTVRPKTSPSRAMSGPLAMPA